MEHVTAKLGVSERFACKVLGQHRPTQRKVAGAADVEAALTAAIIDWARQYGRYGYRRVTALLRAEGWACNHKRVERIWRREDLKVPARQPKRGRLWLTDVSSVRLRTERANHVWAYDFVEDRTRDGRKLRMLNVVDEFTRECLCIRLGRKLGSAEVIDVLANLFIAHGTPGFIRSDNGPEFVATAVKSRIGGVQGCSTLRNSKHSGQVFTFSETGAIAVLAEGVSPICLKDVDGEDAQAGEQVQLLQEMQHGTRLSFKHGGAATCP